MPRVEFLSFLVAIQILLGIIFGPAIVFWYLYGNLGYALHQLTAFVAILLYCAWMLGEMRREVRRISASSLRSGLFATQLFCIAGSSILALWPLSLKMRVDPHLLAAVVMRG